MKKSNSFPYLREILLKMLFFRLFIPLTVIGIVAIIGIGSLEWNNIQKQQEQIVYSMAHMIDSRMENEYKILDAIGRVGEVSSKENIRVFMKSEWEASKDFDTIYYLDNDKKIAAIIPSNPRCIGLDMSNLANFKKYKKRNDIIISQPFISLSTGEPTVYLIKSISHGGYIVGELSLTLLQTGITKMTKRADRGFLFLMDENGTLLAHPSINLVKQQTNMSNLKIFHSTKHGKDKAFYSSNGNMVIGTSCIIDDTGWIVVSQVSLFEIISSYALALVIMLIASLIIWVILMLYLKKQLQNYIITPIQQLTKVTNHLTLGEYDKVNFCNTAPIAFDELNKLLTDFQFMSHNLQLRETALQENESRYRGLVDRMSIGLFCAALNGEILEINPMIMSVLGYSERKELLQVNIIKFLSEALQNEDEGKNKFIIKNICDLDNVEAKLKCNDGKLKWVNINSHIVYDSKGHGEFFECSIKDITERIETESKINEQQELLFKAEKEQRETLEKALVMKDEFITLISHEFKTPLNVIYSAIQLIQYAYFNKIPERVKKLVGNIEQNTFRQLRLVNNLLDITRMKSGQIKLNMKNIDIVFLSRAIAQSVELYAEQKNIKMCFESNLESYIISIDEEKFERIMLNLLSNAMKFTNPEGKITIDIRANIESNFMQVKVIDTGIGIPKDKQKLIFERFGQVDSNLSRQAEGTGIGLSLVKLLVDKLDGTIEVESEINLGSTFILTLPVKKAVIDEEVAASLEMDIDDKLISEAKVQFSDIYL